MHHWRTLSGIAVGVWLGIPAVGWAQSIVPAPDGTGTHVEATDGDYAITGGATAADGSNLFHSFTEFNLLTGERATFFTDPAIQNILGRITGGNLSAIDGLLQVSGSNANLFLLNPAGILFGPNAALNLSGSFSALTADQVNFATGTLSAIGTTDYATLVGDPIGFSFSSPTPGSVVNAGNLSVPAGESVVLVGGQVINTGTLTAPGGNIVISAVEGENRVRIEQEGMLLNLEIETRPAAETSALPFTPLALPDLLTGSAIADASGVQVNPDGTITLTGSDLALPNRAGSAIASGILDTAQPTTGSGGNLTILGDTVGLLGATLDAAGATGGGQIRIGGSYQGSGPLPNATVTYLDADTQLNADGLIRGNGGQIIVWSEAATRSEGRLSARGGSLSGDGGLVETSSRGFLAVPIAPNVGAANGTGGTWLLDPYDIEIVADGLAGFDSTTSPFVADGSFEPAQISWFVIEEAFDFASEVIISTGTGGPPEGGTITILEDFIADSLDSSNTLRLEAARDILVLADIIVPSGLNLDFLADRDGNNTGSVVVAADTALLTPGNIFLQGSDDFSGGVRIDGAVESTAGNITLIGAGTGGDMSAPPSDGVAITGTVSAADTLILEGSSLSFDGISITGSASAGNNLLMTGSSLGTNGIDGVSILGSVSAGNQIAIAGTSTNFDGVFITGSVNAGTDLSLTGDSSGDNGIFISGGSVSAGGDIFITGTSSGDVDGVSISGTVDAANSAFIDGSSSNFDGVFITGSINAGNRLLITGTSSGDNGVFVSGGTVTAGNELILEGRGFSGAGVQTDGFLDAVNNLVIDGRSSESEGVRIGGSAFSSGDLSIFGEGFTGPGIDIVGAIDAFGNFTVRGISNDAAGVFIGSSLFSEGDLTIVGDSLSGDGIQIVGSADAFNSLLIDGISAESAGVRIEGSATSSGNLQIFGDSQLGAGVQVDSLGAAFAGGVLDILGSSLVSDGAQILGSVAASGGLIIEGSSVLEDGVEIGSSLVSFSGAPLILLGSTLGDAETDNAIQVDGAIASTGGDILLESFGGNIRIDGFVDARGSGGDILLSTPDFLQVLGTTADNHSIVTAEGAPITVEHGGDGFIPFLVGDASINGTAGSITNGETTLSPVQSFLSTTIIDNIAIITDDIADCVANCEDDLVDEGEDSDSEETSAAETEDPPIDFDESATEETFDDNAWSAQEDTYSNEYTNYFGLTGATPLTLETAQDTLRTLSAATATPPALVYTQFSPRQALSSASKQGSAVLESSPDDVLELVIITPDGEPKRFSVPEATRARVTAVTQQLLQELTDPTRRRQTAYLDISQQLYDWLIMPLEPTLAAADIGHISFIMAPGLRSLPLAALHNGQRFLIEDYSVGLMPSLSLTDTTFADIREAPVLAMGASEFQELPDLPAVPLELSAVTGENRPGEVELNQRFTINTLLNERQQLGYPLLHLATHAEFRSGGPGDAYIQFWDQRLGLDQIRQLRLNDPPLELLVLSACQTAVGDPSAELGFAGLAVQAGVKSAMASLWRVSDLQTAGLMAEFYAELGRATYKAEALRQAQLAMLREEVMVEDGFLIWEGGRRPLPAALRGVAEATAHPYYWAAFTIVGSPW